MAPALDGAAPPRWLWVALVVVLASVVAWGARWSLSRPSGISGAGPEPGTAWEIPDFRLTDQDGRPFGKPDLQGKPWVAGFIFTRCTTLCPRVVERMARIQKTSAVPLVCFSVDPEHDTPAVLKAYAEKHGMQAGRWHLLTGPKDEVYALVGKGFKLSAKPNPSAAHPGDLVTHSDRLVLVGPDGKVRGTFSSGDPEAMGRLYEALK